MAERCICVSPCPHKKHTKFRTSAIIKKTFGFASAMPTLSPAENRAKAAQALAEGPSFDEACQLAWATTSRIGEPPPSKMAIEALTHALIEGIERGACPEFVCMLLLDGAKAEALSDDGEPLWRNAAHLDSLRPPADRCSWIVMARLALGENFLRHRHLGKVKAYCATCVAELELILRAQDEHFQADPEAKNCDALFSGLDKRYDDAMNALLSDSLALGQRPPSERRFR